VQFLRELRNDPGSFHIIRTAQTVLNGIEDKRRTEIF